MAVQNDFWDDFSDTNALRDIVLNEYGQEYLLGLAMSNDPDFVEGVVHNYPYLLAEALRKLEGMSVQEYLRLVGNHYGAEVLAPR